MLHYIRRSLLLGSPSRALFSCLHFQKRLLCSQRRASPVPLNNRSWLFVSKPEQCEEISKSQADVVVVDMEDGVPAQLKASTRQAFSDVLRSNALNHPRIFVRLNELESKRDLEDDIKYLSLPQVAGFVLPKIMDCSTLVEFETAIAAAEKKHNLADGYFKLVPIIETTSAFFHTERIARGSKRVVGLITGMSDFMADSLCDEFSATYMTYLSHVLITCRAANIVPIAGVCEKLEDFVVMETFYTKMKACGFAGSAVLTPLQAVQANIVYSCATQETQWAREVLRDASKQQESGTFIGPPHHKKALAIVDGASQSQAVLETRDGHFLKGRTSSRGLQQCVKVGRSMEVPLEVTVTESWLALWNGSFLTHDSISSSTERASQLGLPAIPAPFALVNTLALSLAVNYFSHSAIMHLGCYDNIQNTPLYPGDTVRAQYQITDAVQHEKRARKFTIIDSTHRLVNQHDQTVFTARKRTMFPPLLITREEKASADVPLAMSEWRHNIINQPASVLEPVPKQPTLSQGDLLLHDDYKVFSSSEMRMLAKLFKITNPHHHNQLRFSSSDILVPGHFVVAAMLSNTGYDVGDVLYEEVPVHTNFNRVNPGDQIGTLTYVLSAHALSGRPDLEEVTLVHVGVKNTDLATLQDMGIPAELFSDDVIKHAQYEQMCADRCPVLYRKIACKAVRRVIRHRGDVSI